jgi:uncharacterized protein (DUF433 family)
MEAVKAKPKIKTVVVETAEPQAVSQQTVTPPITSNPERLGGTPTIAGTRLPVVTLLDYLNDEQAISKFKADFPGITDEQIQAVIGRIREALEEGWLAEPVDY